jgi:beta-N-acetylhexosaminidase
MASVRGKRRSAAVYRRRRRGAATLLVALAVAATLGVESALGDEAVGPDAAEIERMYLATVPERALIGQRLMVEMEGSATPELIRQAREGEIGGVIVFPPLGQPPEELRREIVRLQDAASVGGRPPLLVSTDQEGGEIKRLPEGPPDSAPRGLASGKGSEARAAGDETGRYLARLGINVDLAPVLDVPASSSSFIASRAFGDDVDVVSAAGIAFAEGLTDGGVIPAAKHFPGLGKAVANTDLEPSRVDAEEGELQDDLAPFRDAIAREVPMIMVGHATYTALDPRLPAALSGAAVSELLRDELGFDGVVISDDLGAGAVLAASSEREAPVAATQAGIDILLFAQSEDAGPARGALEDALKRGELTRTRLEQSLVRILRLKESI